FRRWIPELGVISVTVRGPPKHFARREHMSMGWLVWPVHHRGPLPNGTGLSTRKRGSEAERYSQRDKPNSRPTETGGAVIPATIKRGRVPADHRVLTENGRGADLGFSDRNVPIV